MGNRCANGEKKLLKPANKSPVNLTFATLRAGCPAANLKNSRNLWHVSVRG